ncbi:MAG: MazG family protein, partial [Candidatus Dormibacteraeota bacterium]|nr:MazG family protein [Candidatus Dormibacteraeota bacterium]
MSDQPQTERPYPTGIPAVFEIVRRLRAPDGCPWDREQTHRSLRPYLLEETYEVLETLDRGDDDEHLREELGDLLLQVAMHAAIAEEEGRFTAADVSEGEAAKMVSRHPHVFGDVQVSSAEEVLRNWEARKAADAAANGKADQLVLDRVPSTLPAL